MKQTMVQEIFNEIAKDYIWIVVLYYLIRILNELEAWVLRSQ